jgi:hypothetical protein
MRLDGCKHKNVALFNQENIAIYRLKTLKTANFRYCISSIVKSLGWVEDTRLNWSI